MSADVKVLRPEFSTVPQLLEMLAQRHAGATAAVVVLFQDGQITLVAKATPELVALAGAHMLRAAVT